MAVSRRSLAYLAAGGLILAAWVVGFFFGAHLADILEGIL